MVLASSQQTGAFEMSPLVTEHVKLTEQETTKVCFLPRIPLTHFNHKDINLYPFFPPLAAECSRRGLRRGQRTRGQRVGSQSRRQRQNNRLGQVGLPPVPPAVPQ